MNCCEKCFRDAEVKAIIKGSGSKGKCDFCCSNNVYVCDTVTNVYLRETFETLLDIYTPLSEIDGNYPKEKADLLKNILYSQWNIFCLETDNIYRFLVELFPDKYQEQSDLFDAPVGIAEGINSDYLNEYSLLGTYQWEDFVQEIKETNRFHTEIIKKDILQRILESTCKHYKAGQTFFRARIWTDDVGFKEKDMGAPPARKASAGRANPEGISCLYLANTADTTLYETKAGVYDYATVAEFKLLKDIEIINLATIDKISPFQGIDSSLLAINLPHLKKIGNEISKPLRRHDSVLDYLPTQYISDYIKSVGFDGIEYKSTMCKNGINLAIFDENILECIDTKTYDIDLLSYSYAEME